MSFANFTEASQYIDRLDRLLCLESTDGLITVLILAFYAVSAVNQREVIDLVIVIVLQSEI